MDDTTPPSAGGQPAAQDPVRSAAAQPALPAPLQVNGDPSPMAVAEGVFAVVSLLADLFD